MGTANSTSKSPLVGLPLNPRVDYADDQSKTVGKPVLIDAPVLVNMKHGTVRYRYTEEQEDPEKKTPRIEHPHEGPERSRKHGYFFHSRLNDFSEQASYDKEESWKFSYVYKGPTQAKQKQLYYVFGKGLKINQDGFLEPKYRPQGKGFQWPDMYKRHGHMYYDITFATQDEELIEEEDEEEEEDETLKSTASNATPTIITLSLGETETVVSLKRRVAIMVIKPIGQIHLFHSNTELLQLAQKICSLRSPSDGTWQRFRIILTPK